MKTTKVTSITFDAWAKQIWVERRLSNGIHHPRSYRLTFPRITKLFNLVGYWRWEQDTMQRSHLRRP